MFAVGTGVENEKQGDPRKAPERPRGVAAVEPQVGFLFPRTLYATGSQQRAEAQAVGRAL